MLSNFGKGHIEEVGDKCVWFFLFEMLNDINQTLI